MLAVLSDLPQRLSGVSIDGGRLVTLELCEPVVERRLAGAIDDHERRIARHLLRRRGHAVSVRVVAEAVTRAERVRSSIRERLRHQIRRGEVRE